MCMDWTRKKLPLSDSIDAIIESYNAGNLTAAQEVAATAELDVRYLARKFNERHYDFDAAYDAAVEILAGPAASQ